MYQSAHMLISFFQAKLPYLILPCSVLFCSVLFCSVLFCPVMHPIPSDAIDEGGYDVLVLSNAILFFPDLI